MKIIVQRVRQSSVSVAEKVCGSCGKGLNLLVGFERKDTHHLLMLAVKKILNLRIFEDSAGKMNLSVLDIKGSLLVIPNFTLAADLLKGTRPSFATAMAPSEAKELFSDFCSLLQEESNLSIAEGIFGADMQVSIENDGPVTIILTF